jgi:hypothetical protein
LGEPFDRVPQICGNGQGIHLEGCGHLAVT